MIVKFDTVDALKTVHAAQKIINSRSLSENLRTELIELSESVLSCVALYLRHPKPICRKEQKKALDLLKQRILHLNHETDAGFR